MKINEITIKYGRTINIGNFENIKIGVVFGAEIEENDDIEKVCNELRNLAKKEAKKLIVVEKQKTAKDFY